MDNNQASIEFYKNIASKINDAKDVKLIPINDYTNYDIEFIAKYTCEKLIDMGSGTGLIINNLTEHFKSITAVELFEEFSQYILRDKNIKIVHENLLTYKTEERYNLATMFGVAHHFNSDESLMIYKNVFAILNINGVFILKNQFALEKTKTVTYSKELGAKYFAQYRELSFEIERLKSIGFKEVDIIDIYPIEANRWDDTHFYALVCQK